MRNNQSCKLCRWLPCLLALLMLLCLPVRMAAALATSAGSPVAYASFSEKASTLTFCYGDLPAGQSAKLYILYPDSLAEEEGGGKPEASRVGQWREV